MIVFINLGFKESETVVLTLDWEHGELEALTHTTVTRLKLNPEIVALPWGYFIFIDIDINFWKYLKVLFSNIDRVHHSLTTHDDGLLGAAAAGEHRWGLSLVRPVQFLRFRKTAKLYINRIIFPNLSLKVFNVWTFTWILWMRQSSQEAERVCNVHHVNIFLIHEHSFISGQ